MARTERVARTALVVLCAAVFLDSMDLSLMGVALLSLITTTFAEGAPRNRALGVYSLAGATGYTAGLIASGLLAEISWRLVFFLPVPVAALVLAAAPLALPRDVRPQRARGGFDAAGAVAVTGGVLLLVFALTERNWPAGVVAVALLGGFVLIQRGRPSPLVPLEVFRSGTVGAANLAALTWACATIGWQFVTVLYLQQVLGYTALATGLGIVPMGLAIVVTANLAGRLISRWGLGRVAAAGMLVQGAGILLFLRAGVTGDYLTVLMPALVVHGVGNGLSFPSLNIAAVAGLPDARQGLASGLVTSSVQIGAGVGVAVLAAVLPLGGSPLAGYRLAFLVAGGFSLLGALVAAYGLRARRPAAVPID